MDLQPTTALFRRIARLLGAGVALGGVLGVASVPLAWMGLGPVDPIAAAGVAAAGLALAVLAPEHLHPAARRAGQVLALLAVGVGGLLVGLQLLGPERALLGRTPLPLAAALLLLGLALATLDARTRSGHRPAQLLAMAAGLVPLQAAIAFCYGIDAAPGARLFAHVGVPAGTGAALLCAGVVLARPEHGVLRVIASSGPAGFMSRRLLVAIVLLPIGLGWLFLVAGLRAGQYEAMVGASLVVLSAVVLGAAAVWWNALAIQRVDDERTRAEEALRAEREWFRTTVASIGDAVIAADARGRVTDLNAAAENLIGVRADVALGLPLDGVFTVHGANRRALESPFERVLRERRVVNLPRETVLVARGGDEFPVEGCAAPIRDRRGRPHGVVLVFRDIRERRRVEEERAGLLARERAARAEAEQASRAKDEFIATLSHELRTPLNSVLGWARLLRLGKLDQAGVARAVEAIERGATTQAQIVDDLLDMARVVRGQLRLDVRPVELVPVVEAAIDTVRPAAAARDIEIAAVLEPRAGPVPGDPGRLQQVCWNLLTNAVKFTPPGGRVEVRLSRVEDHVELVVRDTGAGIPPEFLPHVFERFRQADSSTTRAHGGLGLGLSIVRHLVEAHGGTVSADSAGPNMGSTFTVCLPLAPVKPRREPSVIIAGPDGAQQARMLSLEDVRVLVVDDDADTLDLVRQLLEHAGAQVNVAASVTEALACLRRSPPDVLLSDLGMPGQDGYALMRRVRELAPEHGGRVPAAALSAFAHPDHLQEAYAAGFQVFLAKPIEPSELTRAVARLAGRAA